MPFPPSPQFPKAIDSDYTLYLVYNTTETKLLTDNAAWAQEISIVPVDPDNAEIWPNNGFGNIEGELFYYDSVEFDSHGKVTKLKGCARQLSGEKTKFNKRNTWVRGYVVAQHHNQLVDAILKTQNFIGRNFTPDKDSLDWRIRNLQALDVIFDDFSCPDIDFTFNTLENDPVRGILTEYSVAITPLGSVNNFRIDFGDGEFTTTALSGQHRYALNARIDPVIRVSNDKCQIIQTPIERDNPAEPQAEATNNFDVPLPEIQPVPDFTFVPCTVPEPDINVPPLVVPCISLEGQVGPIPSVITGPNIQLVSQVTITSNFPVNITQSIVSIIGGNIPSLIIIDPPIPPTIIIDPPIPPTIVIVPPQSNITLDFDFSELPRMQMDWGAIPQMEVALTMSRQVKSPQKFAADPNLINEFGTDFADLFDVSQTTQVEYEAVGIPSEINLIVPELKDFKIDHGDLFNKKIQIDTSSVNIPTDIVIHGPETPIPSSIKIDASELPTHFALRHDGTPIKLDASDVPRTIKLEMERDIPERIIVEMPTPIPSKIEIELIAPTSIPIHIPEGIGLPIIFPTVMPEIPFVWKGPPVEVKITMDQIMDKQADGKNCVMITPCPRN